MLCAGTVWHQPFVSASAGGVPGGGSAPVIGMRTLDENATSIPGATLWPSGMTTIGWKFAGPLPAAVRQLAAQGRALSEGVSTNGGRVESC